MRALALLALGACCHAAGASTATTMVDLAPDSRELDVELGWSAALSSTSSMRLGVARAFNAGHVAGASDTAGFVTLVLR